MRTLLSVDPSITACGWALWRDGQLDSAGLLQPTLKTDHFLERVNEIADELCLICPDVDQTVTEWPQVYRYSQRGAKDPNNLLPMAALVGAIRGWGPTDTVLPAQWKGQMSKETCGTRVLSRLSVLEGEALEACLIDVAKSLQHNVLDAVGIGLFHLGRFGRKRIIAR